MYKCVSILISGILREIYLLYFNFFSLLNLNTQITIFNKSCAHIKAIVSTTTKFVFHIDNWKFTHLFHCKSFLMAALHWLLKRKKNRTILSFGFPISICDNITTIWFYVPLVMIIKSSQKPFILHQQIHVLRSIASYSIYK